MRLSIESGLYLVANGALTIFNIRSNPYVWLSCFALGVLAGGLHGEGLVKLVNSEYSTPKFKREVVSSLIDCIPGAFTTIINLIALDVIHQKMPFRGNVYLTKPAFVGVSAFLLGFHLGKFIQLDDLSRSKDPYIQELLERAEI